MCYERWMTWRRERAEEEGRRVWDLFDRETRTEPPRPLSDEPEVEAPKPTAPEHATASTPR